MVKELEKHITLDEVRTYVKEKGPVESYMGALTYYCKVRLGQIILMRYPQEKRFPRLRLNLSARID